MASSVRITDGSWDFASGVDSGKIPTVASALMPHGLGRDQLAWLSNATVRGGGITQRTGWQPLCTVHPGGALYQGGWLYDNSKAGGNPYLMLSIGGDLYQVRVDTDNSVVNVSAAAGISDPALVDKAFFTQGEEFMVKQAGDGTTLPLFWDGTTLRRSNGLAVAPYELPPALSMDYYMGRIWYSQGRTYSAGDIVGGSAGTAGYNKRDSVLKVSENPLALAGDGFTVPTAAGNIHALRHSANLDTALGEGQLFVFTRKQVYSLTVPVTRADWINSKEPLQRVALINSGCYGDRCVVSVNGDLFYQAPDGIRSLTLAVRNFQQWGNTPISSNENRILRFNNRGLMRMASGIQFDNRMLQTVLPEESDVGTVFKAIVPLDFDLISTLSEKLPPAWEGHWEGLPILQLFEGDFGGLQRAFAVVRNPTDGSIAVWELTTSNRRENGDNRVSWYVETPAFTWGKEFELKKLDGAEIWFDKVFGTVEMEVYYRPDAAACWEFWTATKFCSARSTCEDVNYPVCYPEQPYAEGREGYRFPITLPTPPAASCQRGNSRPLNIGYQFQLKIVIKGWCQVRGVLLHAIPVGKAPFEGMAC